MRSIFGRSRVTQTVRPLASRGGSFSAGTSGSLAPRQARKPPSSALGGDALMPSQAATPWLSFRPFWQTTMAAPPFELRRPAPRLGRASAGASRDQPRIGGEIVVVADVDDGGAVRRADEAGELFSGNGVDRRHDASSDWMGRDASACRLVGRSLSPCGELIVCLQAPSRLKGVERGVSRPPEPSSTALQNGFLISASTSLSFFPISLRR